VTGNKRVWLFAIARNAVCDFYHTKKHVAMDEGIEAYLRAESVECDFEKKDKMISFKKRFEHYDMMKWS